MTDPDAPVPVYFGAVPSHLTRVAKLPVGAIFVLTTQGALRDYIEAHPETKRT